MDEWNKDELEAVCVKLEEVDRGWLEERARLTVRVSGHRLVRWGSHARRRRVGGRER